MNYAKIYPLRPGASNYLLPVGNNHKHCYLGVGGWGSGIHGEGGIPFTPVRVFNLSWWVCMLLLPLSPTHPTSHLPNNTAYDNNRLLREVESVQKYFPVYSFYRLLSLLTIARWCNRPTTYCWRVKHYLMWGSRHLGTFHETKCLLYSPWSLE